MEKIGPIEKGIMEEIDRELKSVDSRENDGWIRTKGGWKKKIRSEDENEED